MAKWQVLVAAVCLKFEATLCSSPSLHQFMSHVTPMVTYREGILPSLQVNAPRRSLSSGLPHKVARTRSQDGKLQDSRCAETGLC